MPLLASRKATEGESSSASVRTRSSASSHRSGGSSSHRASELRARYEMAQAIQKPWPLHLLENGVKANANLPSTGSSSRSTRSANHTSTRSTSSSRRESRSTATLPATHADLARLDVESSKKKSKRSSTTSLDKLSLSPTLTLTSWIRRSSKDSDKSGRSSSPGAPSSSNTSPTASPKDLL